MLKTIAALFCCAVLFAVFPVSADQWNKKTIVTFSEPVELPRIVLPAGTYVFKLADSLSNRNIVQVFNADETHIFTTILAIPDYRLTPSEKTVLRFEERPVHTPEAIRAWFYPGDNFGQEFVYPKARAAQLAQATHLPVLSADLTPAEKPEELLKAPVVAVTPEKKEIEISAVIESQPPAAVAPAPVPAAPVPAAPAPAQPEPVKELPKTASPLPLMALLGLSSLGLAGLLRLISKRIS